MNDARIAAILHIDDIPARDRGDGIRTFPLVTRCTGATRFINGYTILPPLAAVPLHFHNCDESVVLIEGDAIACIEGVEHALKVGDATFIPAGAAHFFRNVSEIAELKILWTYASVDADRTLVATGQTRLIDDEHAATSVPR